MRLTQGTPSASMILQATEVFPDALPPDMPCFWWWEYWLISKYVWGFIIFRNISEYKCLGFII